MDTYRYARFLARNYVFLFFGIYGSLAAESLSVWVGMALFGFCVDLARKRWVPELSESPSQLYRRLRAARKNVIYRPPLNIVKRPIAAIFCVTWIYFLGIITVQKWMGYNALTPYYEFFEHIIRIMAMFSRFQEILVIKLHEVGFFSDASLTEHVYAITHLGMAIWMVLVLCFSGVQSIGKEFNHKKYADVNNRFIMKTKYLFMFLLLIFAISASMELLDSLSDQCNGDRYMNVCRGYAGFYFGIMSYLLIVYGFSVFLYQMILLALCLNGISDKEFRDILEKESGNG